MHHKHAFLFSILVDAAVAAMILTEPVDRRVATTQRRARGFGGKRNPGEGRRGALGSVDDWKFGRRAMDYEDHIERRRVEPVSPFNTPGRRATDTKDRRVANPLTFSSLRRRASDTAGNRVGCDWSLAEDSSVRLMTLNGYTQTEIAAAHGRLTGGIVYRQAHLLRSILRALSAMLSLDGSQDPLIHPVGDSAASAKSEPTRKEATTS